MVMKYLVFNKLISFDHSCINSTFLKPCTKQQELFLFSLQAFCEEGNIEDNGILAFAKFVIFSVLESRNQTGWFTNLDVYFNFLVIHNST